MAGRIPQSFIDELLTRTDIVSVIERFLTLKKAGANYAALCPFHQEKTASFTVSPSKQFYHCFGCGVSGNAISFLMAYEHLDFVEAVETLADQIGMPIPREAMPQTEMPNQQPLYDILEKASQFYQQCLRKNSRAINYLKQRGLTGKIAKQFSIGYAPAGWDNLVKTISTNDTTQNLLSRAGLIINKNSNNYYDRFRDRIMFPIRDRRGRIIAFGGRVIGDDLPKYLNSPETAVFHKSDELYGLYEVRKTHNKLDRLLIVEGYMDVVSLFQHGITYAVATLGTATSTQHIQQLFRISKEVVFCFDGDEAGLAAAWRAVEILMPLLRDDWSAKFMFLPQTEDPDSLIRKIGKQKFEIHITQAKTLSEFFFHHLTQQVDMKPLDGRAHFVSLAMPHIKKIPANIMKTLFLENLAKLAQTRVENLKNYLSSDKIIKTPMISQPIATKISLVQLAIILLLQHPNLIEYLDKSLPSLNLPNMDLFNELIQLIQHHPGLSTGAILEYFRNRSELDLLARLASQEHMIPPEGLAAEFYAIIQKLHNQALEHQIECLIAKANQGELAHSEKELLQNLLKKKQESQKVL